MSSPLTDPAFIFLAVVGAAFFYFKFLVYPDIDPVGLEHQSNVSQVRNEGESAIYRATSASFGRPLLGGLSIASGPSRQTRPGTFRDFWTIASQNLTISSAKSTPTGSVAIDTIDKNDAAKILSVLGPLLQETRGQNQSSTVCILATNSVESLLTIFAAILYNIPISIIHTDSESLAKLELLLQAANPFAILVADETLLKDVLLEKYTPHLRRILYTGAPLEGPIPLSISVGQWNTVINNAHLGTASTDIQLPDEQNFGAPVRVVYPNANGGAAVAEFFHHNIAAAIASNIKFLPKSHQWTPEDTVLLFASQFSVYTLVAQLSTLISHATLAFVDHESVLPSAVLESVKPTILINDNYSTLSLLNLSQSLTLGQEIRLALNRAALSRGSLNKTPVVEYFKSVRQIFSSTLVYPGQQEAIAASDNSKAIDDLLTCEDSNTIRALAGAHLFHALTTPLIASPISQTTIWDYRLETPDTFKGKPVISVNFGPVVSCIEARLVDAPAGQGSVDRYNYGLLQVRGCSSGNDIDIWVSTGINAVFTSDGCLRLMYEK